MSATAPNISAEADAFCNRCVYLRSLYVHYETLFERTGLRNELMKRVAPIFFGDLAQALAEIVVLEVCKLTDPEGRAGRRNLSVEYLVNNYDRSAPRDETDALRSAAAKLHAFRAKVEPARNKLIGHLDLDAVLSGEPLGGAALDEWRQFWLDLQDFARIVHKRYVDGDGAFYVNAVGYVSDAELLVKALKESVAYGLLLEIGSVTRECADVAFNSKYYEA